MIKNKRKKKKKDPNVYPAGWDYKRAKVLADYYDARQGEDVLAEVRTMRTVAELVWMEVSQELVPQVRKLIARRRRTA